MSRTEINTFGEFKLIEHLTDQFSIFHDTTLKGVGDDAAVLDLGAETVSYTHLDVYKRQPTSRLTL